MSLCTIGYNNSNLTMVFDGNIEATELLLKIILKKNDIQVISVAGQRELQSPVVGGRDIRLDILAKDSTGKHYNVEVQKKPEGAHIRRARFNSSMMDSRMLKAGQDYYNYLAKDSLERMKPFGDESFDTVEQDFPVEYVQAKPVVW